MEISEIKRGVGKKDENDFINKNDFIAISQEFCKELIDMTSKKENQDRTDFIFYKEEKCLFGNDGIGFAIMPIKKQDQDGE